METIDLNRRFVTWSHEDESDPEILSLFGSAYGTFGWGELLERKRVVILAEAGSGKTIELTEQARQCAENGRCGFYATVQNVGRYGLESALGASASIELAAWKASKQSAWFFIDSVDEAKTDGIKLVDALQRLADGIIGGEARAHIVLSGRHTDWEFRRDFQSVSKWIPVPPAHSVLPPPDPDDLLINIIRQEPRDEDRPALEKPLVVVLAALDKERVQTFAAAKDTPQIDQLLKAIEKQNLWNLARRPIDLDWLVEYWNANLKLGSLAKMLELSVKERLCEKDPQRDRHDPLDSERALSGLERVGAALVLGRQKNIVIPDEDVSSIAAGSALDLAEVLPDWSGSDRTRFITRPVFDPATFGRARLHNDNEDVVSSYLFARWIKRRREANCPIQKIHDLFFADTYGVALVKPSMRKTAAWLSLWNSDVAREVLAREPRLLLDAGDPASLPLAIRKSALNLFLDQLVADKNFEIPDHDSLRRFSAPDMAECVQMFWNSHGDTAAARHLLLLMIWLGELTNCSDLVVGASFDAYPDRYSRVFSGRALMATANSDTKRRYATFIRENCDALQNVVVWDAIDGLFPTHLDLDDLFVIFAAIEVSDRDGGLGLDWNGPKLVSRLTSTVDVERLLSGLIGLLGGDFSDPDEPEMEQERSYFPIIAAAAHRLLELSPLTDAPAIAVDATLRLGEQRRYVRASTKSDYDILALLRETPQRRRSAFWHAADWFRTALNKRDRELYDIWQMEMRGFSLELSAEDIDWLLEDAPGRSKENDRRLAINAASRIWRDCGSDRAMLSRINAVVEGDPVMTDTLTGWTQAKNPSREETDFECRQRAREQRNAIEQAERDQSWKDFANRLRENPDQLRQIPAPTEQGVDARLSNLWKIVSRIDSGQSRYAIDDLTPLEQILGQAVVEAASDAFVAYWRRWKPRVRIERPPDQRKIIYEFDCMGILGVTLEAKQPGWAERLSNEDAALATIYATLELSGFPAWLKTLAGVKPEIVSEVLSEIINAEFDEACTGSRCDTLEDVSCSDVVIMNAVAPTLFEQFVNRENLPAAPLNHLLLILRRGLLDPTALVELALARFQAASDNAMRASYLTAVFPIDPASATDALMGKLDTLPAAQQTVLVQAVLPGIVGSWSSEEGIDFHTISFANLERLVIAAYDAIRVEDDTKHPSGEVYTVGDRDKAQEARGATFKALVKTPGLATFEALHRLAETEGFSVDKSRLEELASERAAGDSESDPWKASDVFEFEEDFDTTPRTTVDLQRLASQRLADLQHKLLHGDFNQAATVAILPDETAVQNWIAERLELMRGRAYSVERESHVADEKEPDVRLRAKATDATLPIEIKVAESWSIRQLETAVSEQLCGQYLRDSVARHGLLLLVHQKPRVRGWQDEQGNWLGFDKIVERLKELAWTIAAAEPEAPQPQIVVIDVSSATPPTGC